METRIYLWTYPNSKYLLTGKLKFLRWLTELDWKTQIKNTFVYILHIDALNWVSWEDTYLPSKIHMVKKQNQLQTNFKRCPVACYTLQFDCGSCNQEPGRWIVFKWQTKMRVAALKCWEGCAVCALVEAGSSIFYVICLMIHSHKIGISICN